MSENQQAICPECKRANPVGSKFCNQCGASLQGAAVVLQDVGRGKKACPHCGGVLNARAVVCKHCKANLGTGAEPGSQAGKKKTRRSTVILILIGLCVVFGIIGQLFSGKVSEERAARATSIAVDLPAETATEKASVPAVTRTPIAPTETPVPSNTPLPTDTHVPTDTPVPTETPLPTEPPPPAATEIPPFVPGLEPHDVTVNLEERKGFVCDSRSRAGEYYVWGCTVNEETIILQVDVWARSLGSVDLIEAMVLQPDALNDDLALGVLGFVATMPYDGAEPERARAWVEEQIPTITVPGESRTTEFGGVPFELAGVMGARTLYMGNLVEP